jgi:translation initiation factor 3 subunit C
MAGKWQKAYDYLAGLTSWNLVPHKAFVLALLREKLQEEGLRTYLLAYGSHYQSLSHDQLCEMFDLPEKKVWHRSKLVHPTHPPPPAHVQDTF